MDFISAFRRPEYFYRPFQVVRRVIWKLHKPSEPYITVCLPWGLPIRVSPHETIGSSIGRLGIHELPNNECILRLIDPGETVLDVGANVGQMTSAMAMAAGPSGTVIAFEPHPLVFEELQFNIDLWRKSRKAAKIVANQCAIGDRSGTAKLQVPRDFRANHGMATLADDSSVDTSLELIDVKLATLDEIIEEGQKIGFLKIDVEGHELEVLRGASRLIFSGCVRDILFEEFEAPPTPVTDFLESAGYTLFRIERKLSGLLVLPPREKYQPRLRESPNYIATREPDRTRLRLAGSGWIVYSRKW